MRRKACAVRTISATDECPALLERAVRSVITHQKINLSSFWRGFYPGSTTVSRISHGTQAGYLFRLPNPASSPASTRKRHYPVPFSFNLSSHLFVARPSPQKTALPLLLLGTSLVANNVVTLTPSLYRWFQLQVALTLWKGSTILKPDISVHRDFIPARECLTMLTVGLRHQRHTPKDIRH